MTIPSNDSYYDILEEEHENIYLNGIVWCKVKNEMWRVIIIQIPSVDRKEDSEYLKIKWIDTIKEDKVIIKNVSLD